MATVKTAIRVWTAEDHKNHYLDEQIEMKKIEKLLERAKKQKERKYLDNPEEEEKKEAENKADNDSDDMLNDEDDEDSDDDEDWETDPDQVVFEKLLKKLLAFNAKKEVNSGKEISIVEYIKRLDAAKNAFLKKYENQRHMRRAYLEEFKIHSLNYILLLFESVVRFLTTLNKDENEGADANIEIRKGRRKFGNKNDAAHYYAKNYRRYLEQKAASGDSVVVSCIGWTHVHRCIEVIEMAMRDLVYKIVPKKVIMRELTTSKGKVLTLDSEYVLIDV